jgi:CRISPR-associated endonuclease/helicase Cas3
MKNEFYAHSLDGEPPETWHRLEDHLKNVAEIARRFAEDFNAGDWGYLSRLAWLNMFK